MSIAEQIKAELQLPGFTTMAYLQDLTDDELFIRPHEKANHIAWQLGHLIMSEHNLNNMVCPDSMPALPEGFADQHGKDAASSDDKSAFRTKDEYLKAMDEQRAGTVALLDRLSDEEKQSFEDSVELWKRGKTNRWPQILIDRNESGSGPRLVPSFRRGGYPGTVTEPVGRSTFFLRVV